MQALARDKGDLEAQLREQLVKVKKQQICICSTKMRDALPIRVRGMPRSSTTARGGYIWAGPLQVLGCVVLLFTILGPARWCFASDQIPLLSLSVFRSHGGVKYLISAKKSLF